MPETSIKYAGAHQNVGLSILGRGTLFWCEDPLTGP